MKTLITIEVDCEDLDIEYEITKTTEPSEFWGFKAYTDVYEVDIQDVSYNGMQIENYNEEDLIDYIMDKDN